MDLHETLSQNSDDLKSYEVDRTSEINLKQINETLQQMQEDSCVESKRNRRRFAIQTFIAILALVASAIAALASLIVLFL